MVSTFVTKNHRISRTQL